MNKWKKKYFRSIAISCTLSFPRHYSCMHACMHALNSCESFFAAWSIAPSCVHACNINFNYVVPGGLYACACTKMFHFLFLTFSQYPARVHEQVLLIIEVRPGSGRVIWYIACNISQLTVMKTLDRLDINLQSCFLNIYIHACMCSVSINHACTYNENPMHGSINRDWSVYIYIYICQLSVI